MNRAMMGKQIAMAPATRKPGQKMMAGGKPKKMAKGGKVRGDGCCMRGKTKGKMC